VKRSSALRWTLYPFSALYSTISRVRVRCYSKGLLKVRRLSGRVISVGNLTVGGTGKTPMVLWIAERLAQEGKRVAILTRGYRGSVDGNSSGEPQSDEVALLRDRLAGKVQLGVGADRYSNGQTLERHGINWFVLDDGYQHIKLARDANIVLIDATDPFGGGMTLPGGRLREPVSALGRADIVVITRSVQAPASALESVIRRHTQSPIFYASTELQEVLRVPQLAVALPRPDWGKYKFMAFCGIGNSSAFFEDLRQWGITVAGSRSFLDHHVYSIKEMAELEAEAGKCGAHALLCTEKDVWNLRHVQFTGMPVYCCRITVSLTEGFREALDEVLNREQHRASA
jgi:tetraacyldisaccharide 4'-kinase